MAKLLIRYIRGGENGVELEVMIKGRNGQVFHHTRSVPLPAGERIECELPFVTEGPKLKQEAPDGPAIISVPTAEIGLRTFGLGKKK